jgi:hypothetical protein
MRLLYHRTGDSMAWAAGKIRENQKEKWVAP